MEDHDRMKTKMMSRLVVALAIVVLAAACSTPQQATGLRITDFTPELDAIDVAVDTTVSVTFNEALDDESIANGITVVGGGAIRAGEVEYDAATRTLTFTPDTPLAYSTNYLASVPTSVRSATGSSLAAPVAWTFRTAAAPAGAIVGVTVTPATATLQLGGQEAVPLTATVEATGDAPETVTWTSNEQSVATVNSAGVVTAVAPGTATITATSTFDSTKSGSAVITVEAATVDPDPAVTGVSVSPATATVVVASTRQLTATVEAVGGAAETVTWVSSAEGVATVSSTGLVTAVAPGSATITATSTVTPSQSGSSVITVEAATVDPDPVVTGVSVDPASATVVVGATEQLTATVEAVDGASEDVTWSTSDADVATVDGDGLVTAISAGTAIITATSDFDDTVSGSAEITVVVALSLVYPDSPYAYNAGATFMIDPEVENALGTLSYSWVPVHDLNEANWDIDPISGQISRMASDGTPNVTPGRNGNRTYTVTVTDDGPEGVRTATFDVIFVQNP